MVVLNFIFQYCSIRVTLADIMNVRLFLLHIRRLDDSSEVNGKRLGIKGML